MSDFNHRERYRNRIESTNVGDKKRPGKKEGEDDEVEGYTTVSQYGRGEIVFCHSFETLFLTSKLCILQ